MLDICLFFIIHGQCSKKTAFGWVWDTIICNTVLQMRSCKQLSPALPHARSKTAQIRETVNFHLPSPSHIFEIISIHLVRI